MDFSPAERELVEQRLDLIYRLKQKYGGTLAEIAAYHEKITAELETLADSDNRRDQLRAQYRAELVEAKQLAAQLTEARRQAAARLEAEIVRELAGLDMDKVKMRIAVHTLSLIHIYGAHQIILNFYALLLNYFPGCVTIPDKWRSILVSAYDSQDGPKNP